MIFVFLPSKTIKIKIALRAFVFLLRSRYFHKNIETFCRLCGSNEKPNSNLYSHSEIVSNANIFSAKNRILFKCDVNCLVTHNCNNLMVDPFSVR